MSLQVFIATFIPVSRQPSSNLHSQWDLHGLLPFLYRAPNVYFSREQSGLPDEG